MQRADVINRISDLTEQKCQPCEKSGSHQSNEICAGCSVYKELRQLGNQLNGLAGSKKKVDEILAKGQDMSWSEFDWLIETEITRIQISKAMGITTNELREIENTRKGRIKYMKTIEEQLTKGVYMKLKAEGEKDSVIIKQYGMSNAAFYKWKTETLTDEERKATNLAKTTKTPAERAADSKSTKVQETESNAGNEASDTSNEPMVKLKPGYENKTVASKLKDSYKQEIENEVKEKIRLLAAENKELHAKVFSLEEDNERLEGLSENKNAEINALVSNNEDLLGTVERLQKELERVRWELTLATTETVTANLKEVEWAKMMDEMKRQPLEMFPYQAPSVQMIGTGRVEKENEALKTSLKAIVGAYL